MQYDAEFPSQCAKARDCRIGFLRRDTRGQQGAVALHDVRHFRSLHVVGAAAHGFAHEAFHRLDVFGDVCR